MFEILIIGCQGGIKGIFVVKIKISEPLRGVGMCFMSGLKARSLGLNIVPSLVTGPSGQQFVLENCHVTSVQSHPKSKPKPQGE